MMKLIEGKIFNLIKLIYYYSNRYIYLTLAGKFIYKNFIYLVKSRIINVRKLALDYECFPLFYKLYINLFVFVYLFYYK